MSAFKQKMENLFRVLWVEEHHDDPDVVSVAKDRLNRGPDADLHVLDAGIEAGCCLFSVERDEAWLRVEGERLVEEVLQELLHPLLLVGLESLQYEEEK